MIGGAIAYSFFKAMEPNVGAEIALIPTVIILIITFIIALFRMYEMTFLPFIFAIFRYHINYKERYWKQGTDSYSFLDIGVVSSQTDLADVQIEFKSKIERIESLEDKMKKI